MLKKEQIAAIKAVGKACDTTKYQYPLCKYVFSDGAKIYGTNAHILFMEQNVSAPKGAYLPKSAEMIDPKILFLGEDLDNFLKRLHECEARDLYSYSDNGHHVYFRAKYAFDAESKKELYQITFAHEGHFQREALFLKRLIKQAISFVGKGFSLYQSELEETCFFESKDKKRIAIVMGWFKTAAIKLLNDVDLKG
uniref:Uncharacterized protein n=1 Tax=Myoviridae sp. ctwVB15 TaxID=2825208 RepID=A0A8S5UNB8_9CAUD|nr:MAG TPA: hypothetical protein [Myoviridae sp. ctwVB15]